VGVPGDPAADVGNGLVGQADEVEVVGNDPRLRQRLVDGRAVGRARVHRDDLHRVLPCLPARVQPLHDSGLGAARGLSQQAL